MKPSGNEPFCIFKELFQKYDAEAKLILLEEILFIGEAKELWFLETLVTDEDLRVRKRAAVLAKELSGKLQKESVLLSGQEGIPLMEEALNASGDTDKISAMDAGTGKGPLFDIAFDLLEHFEVPHDLLSSQTAPLEPLKNEHSNSPLMEKIIKMLNKNHV